MKIVSIYDGAVSRLGCLAWLPPLLARFTVGWIFLQSGWGKLHSIPKVIEFFVSLEIPAPAAHAYLVATLEFACWLALSLGLFTRLASPPLIVIMIVALLTAKREDISTVSDLFATSEFLYIPLLLYLTISGAGSASLDRLSKKR